MNQSLPTLRAGFEGSGSPRWLMQTLQRSGFDREHGFALELDLLNEARHRHGTLQALAERRVDLVDADRQALAAAQADGLPLLAIAPYGRILGSLMVHRDYRGPAGSGATGLALLRGSRLGVLSLRDKNWRLLHTACRELAGFNLARTVTVQPFATRAELVAALDAGSIDAALLHWHLVPALVARGHRVLAELPVLADALADTLPATGHAEHGDGRGDGRGDHEKPRATATTFFVVHQELATQQPALVAALVAAIGAAVGELRGNDRAWQALADEGALDVTQLAALRQRWMGRVGVFHPPSANAAQAKTSMNSTPSTFRSTPCNPF